jgi:hypothetical protein
MGEQLNVEEGVVHLPSKGLLYLGEDQKPVFPEGLMRVRPMTTREEQILTSARTQASRDQIMYDVVARCVVKEDAARWPFEQFLVGDVLYMLMVLRRVTWGAEYLFEVTCGDCGQKYMVEVKVPDDLRVFVFDEKSKFTEPFELTLPRSGFKLGLRLLRIADEKAISEYARRKGQDQMAVFPFRLARHVVTWQGEELPPGKVLNQILDLQALDTEAIRDKIEDEDCGIDLLLNRDCEQCGAKNEVRMAFTPDFFRSKKSAVRSRSRAAR